MTTKADFTEEEWARLERAPMVAGMAISLADPGGPIELMKESMGTVKTVVESAKPGGDAELVESVSTSVAEKAQKRENPMGDFKPKAGEEIIDELRAANKLVTEKASPEEAEAFRNWLLKAAQGSADAAKEGGFMGIGAEQVSEREEKMLAKLREAMSAPA